MKRKNTIACDAYLVCIYKANKQGTNTNYTVIGLKPKEATQDVEPFWVNIWPNNPNPLLGMEVGDSVEGILHTDSYDESLYCRGYENWHVIPYHITKKVTSCSTTRVIIGFDTEGNEVFDDIVAMREEIPIPSIQPQERVERPTPNPEKDEKEELDFLDWLKDRGINDAKLMGQRQAKPKLDYDPEYEKEEEMDSLDHRYYEEGE